MVTLKQYEKWHNQLTTIDKMNFLAIVELGAKTVAKLPEGQYKEMCVFALAVREVHKQQKGMIC